MNFFEQQDRARGTTRRLVLLFGAAIVSLIIVTTLLVAVGVSVTQGQNPEASFDMSALRGELLLGVSIVVLSVVALGATFRQMQLRGGGKAVAQSMGGRLLNVSTRDADERKILNVVEEMAIASGLPVPQVYLLEDPAINAFAAGRTPQDAVIGVTRGCIVQLNRDELQGVVAHEFSHIFNGDMRLNIRLIGWLYGITVIGLIGYYLMRGQTYRVSSSRENRGGLVMLGLGLVVVGYGGTLFGNLIKAAVSRQREFLADASAVQYTRNPEGISGALKKIGGYGPGSQLSNADASEVSHMLFGQGVKSNFMSLFATHPPLGERIRRIEPAWKGDYDAPFRGARPDPGPESMASFAPAQGASLADGIGEPDEAHLASAGTQLRMLPDALHDAAHGTLGATLLMFALLVVNAEQPMQRRQLGWLNARLNAASYRQFQELLDHLRGLPRPLQLPLVELSLPALRELEGSQYQGFMADLHQVMKLDEHISLFEWSLFAILRYSLDRSRAKVRGATLKLFDVTGEIAILLGALASAGNEGEPRARAAFEAAVEAMALDTPPVLAWRAYPDLGELESAFNRLRRLQPLQKPRLLKAMVRCVEHDAVVTPEEHELLRAAAAILDCPMPPLRLP